MGYFEALHSHIADENQIRDLDIEDAAFKIIDVPATDESESLVCRAPATLTVAGLSMSSLAVAGALLDERGVTDYVYFVTRFSRVREATIVSQDAMATNPAHFSTPRFIELARRVGRDEMETLAADSLIEFIFDRSRI
jgi:hypothetical protein